MRLRAAGLWWLQRYCTSAHCHAVVGSSLLYQERYHSLAPMYYRGAAAAIVVYDITNRVSTDTAQHNTAHPRCPFLHYPSITLRAMLTAVCVDCAQQSFVRAKSWVKELQRQGSANIVIALAGNKLDLAEQRQVDLEEAKAYADDNNIFLLETSAKSNTNVTEIFKQIATALPKNAPAPKSNVVTVSENDILNTPEEKKKCC